MADIRQFSEQSQQRIADAVRMVERSPILRPQLFVRTTSPTARELRWARTTTSLEFPSYPDSGNAVVVEFGDYAISGSPIVSSTNTPSFTAYDPEQKVVALMSAGTLPTQGSVVQCYRHEGQWWIEGTTSAGAQIWTKAASRTTTFSWKFFQSGSSTEDTTSPIELTTNGVYCFPRFFYGTNSNSSGTVFTFNSSPSGFQGGNAINFQQPAYFALTVHTTWRLPPLSESTFNGHFRVASHGHQVTVSGTTYNTTNTTINAQATDSKKGVTIETFANGQLCGSSTIPHFYTVADAPFDYRWATHSGVALITHTGTSPPSSLTIYVRRKENTTDYIGQGELDAMSLTLEQITDIAT
jgi:hypothetical protein